MNKAEKEAREYCAICNWVKECKDCPHREWPEGKWLEKPLFDWEECREWVHYLKNPIKSALGRFLCWLGFHDWFEYTEDIVKIKRRCIRCKLIE